MPKSITIKRRPPQKGMIIMRDKWGQVLGYVKCPHCGFPVSDRLTRCVRCNGRMDHE